MNLKILLAIAGIFGTSAVMASNSLPKPKINFKEEAAVMFDRFVCEYEFRILWDKLSEAIKISNEDKYISKRNQLKNLALGKYPDDLDDEFLNEWFLTNDEVFFGGKTEYEDLNGELLKGWLLINYKLLFSTEKDNEDRPKSQLGTMLNKEGRNSSIDSICEFWPELTVSAEDESPEIKAIIVVSYLDTYYLLFNQTYQISSNDAVDIIAKVSEAMAKENKTVVSKIVEGKNKFLDCCKDVIQGEHTPEQANVVANMILDANDIEDFSDVKSISEDEPSEKEASDEFVKTYFELLEKEKALDEKISKINPEKANQIKQEMYEKERPIKQEEETLQNQLKEIEEQIEIEKQKKAEYEKSINMEAETLRQKEENLIKQRESINKDRKTLEEQIKLAKADLQNAKLAKLTQDQKRQARKNKKNGSN